MKEEEKKKRKKVKNKPKQKVYLREERSVEEKECH